MKNQMVLNVEVDVKNLDKTLEIIEKMKCCQNCSYSEHAFDIGSLICKVNIGLPFDVFYRRKEKVSHAKVGFLILKTTTK